MTEPFWFALMRSVIRAALGQRGENKNNMLNGVRALKGINWKTVRASYNEPPIYLSAETVLTRSPAMKPP
eukprot:848002-Prorocentrum_minimum.AAC.1